MPIKGDLVANYPAGIHSQIIQSGALGTDRWSVGYWLRYDSSVSLPTPTQANTYAANLLAAFQSIVWGPAGTPLKAQQSTDTGLDTCDVRVYNGSVLSVVGQGTQASVVGTGSGPHPGYCAFCVSLLSAFPGRSKRGRMYLPATAMAINSATSQWLTPATQDAIVTNLAAYFANSAHVPSWGSPAAYTPVILSKLLGSTEDVISLRADSIPDTQHGRTRALVASHVSVHTVP